MSETPIRILIADDHPVVRSGLKELLSSVPRLDVVGEAANGRQVVELAGTLRPDVILMDLVMPELNGVEATRRVLSDNPRVRVLALTSFGQDSELFPALEAGATGFLLKGATPEELTRAICRVAEGQPALSPEIAGRLIREHASTPPGQAPPEPLTNRENEVLREIAHGLSNSEIADRLSISTATVRTHVSNILLKLRLNRRTQAALYALRQGIAKLEDGALKA